MANDVQVVAEAAVDMVHVTEASGGLGTLGINLKIFLAQLVNFLIVLFVLWKWAYTPILRMLDERRGKIEASVQQAQEIDQRMGVLEEEQKTVLSEARAQGSELLETARVQAEERKRKMVEQARQEVATIVAQGKAQLQAEKQEMLRSTREEMAGMAVEAARKILGEAVGEQEAQVMAKDVVGEMVNRSSKVGE